MRYLKTSIVTTLAALLVLTLRLQGQAPQQESLVWAPVPTPPRALPKESFRSGSSASKTSAI